MATPVHVFVTEPPGICVDGSSRVPRMWSSKPAANPHPCPCDVPSVYPTCTVHGQTMSHMLANPNPVVYRGQRTWQCKGKGSEWSKLSIKKDGQFGISESKLCRTHTHDTYIHTRTHARGVQPPSDAGVTAIPTPSGPSGKHPQWSLRTNSLPSFTCHAARWDR
jgi:hypothetical protein